ncbi:hypothetical protein C0Q70_11118 [Pomacea canaliculata]|uniref:Uncharacterized protein n=1 Tax=Pomacea canaliculata TaxID=400727 RepID=A0A2T7P545_POMCA|nr:hypothetical protein C0Q70_11118 [Pomacea canaliculata]
MGGLRDATALANRLRAVVGWSAESALPLRQQAWRSDHGVSGKKQTGLAPGREGRQTSFLLDTKQVMKVNEELLNLPETDKH